MSRRTRDQWWLFQTPCLRSARRKRSDASLFRRLRIESLEDRRLLAVVTVDTLADTVNFSDGVTSLREAVFATNLVGGADTIEFAAALTSGGPATILLTQGELAITDSLTINGPGASLLTLQAYDPTPDMKNGDGSRIFNIDDGNAANLLDDSISGVTLTGGDVSGPPAGAGSGGAIRSQENLTVTASTIRGNSVVSGGGNGGGIYNSGGGSLTVTDSTIIGNSAINGSGGGILNTAGILTVTGSTISDNSAKFSGGGILGLTVMVTTSSTIGNSAGVGGGIYKPGSGSLTITNSAISDNTAVYSGGGIHSQGNVMVTGSTIIGNSAGLGGGIETAGPTSITDSTISGNSANGFSVNGGGGGISSGGGILMVTGSTISGNSATGLYTGGGGINSGGDVLVAGSTISGNSASGSGGGIYNRYSRNVTLTLSTITKNEAPDGHGSGVASSGYTTPYHSARTEVHSCIIAGNVHSDVDFVNGPTNTFQSNGYNLIGTGNAVGAFIEPGDQTGIANPLLGPLADNGGPTKSHALMPGSPAIDAGHPAIVAGEANVPLYDQRGAPFTRVYGGRIDIGAFESQPLPAAFYGDYNGNGIVDAADYSVWRDTLGSTTDLRADGNGDGVVNSEDYSFWKSHFGEMLQQEAGSREQGVNSALAEPVAPDNEEPHPLDNSRPLLATASLRPVGETINTTLTEPAAQNLARHRVVLEGFQLQGFGKKNTAGQVRHGESAARQWHAPTSRRDDAVMAWLELRGDVETSARWFDAVELARDSSIDEANTASHCELDATFERLGRLEM